MPLKRFPKAASLCFMNIERTFDIHKVGVYTTSRGSKGTKFPRKIGKNDGRQCRHFCESCHSKWHKNVPETDQLLRSDSACFSADYCVVLSVCKVA